MSGDKTILVTGGAGYVGSHCCKAFAADGWDVVVYDNLSRGWREFVRWSPLIEGDILDYPRLLSAIDEVRPDAVAHFAAVAYVGESTVDPELYYRTNTSGSLNLLRAMVAVGVEALVFSSTCATYGTPAKVPILETDEQRPINPYGWSKLFVEQLLRDFGQAYGLRSVALRYFNAAGADPDGEIGERHQPETHLIPLALNSVTSADDELVVFGNDFATPDGTCIRDYVHVTDLADAHLKALNYLHDGGCSDAFNIASGAGTSVAEILAAVQTICGNPVRARIGPRRAGDPAQLIASAERARAVLGWAAARSDIETILTDAWRWHSAERTRVER